MYRRLRLPALIAAAASTVLAGCATSAGTAREIPDCRTPEVLVCYGKSATRLEGRHRLEEVDFCMCENTAF